MINSAASADPLSSSSPSSPSPPSIPGPELQAVIGHAQKAAEIALAGQRAAQAAALTLKSPGQCVTNADLAAEDALRAGLSRDFPGENIVGEEFGGTPSERFWTLDPIDGTANYVNGLPFWGVAIGRVTGGQPDLGVLILPALNLTLATNRSVNGTASGAISGATGGGTLFLNGAPYQRRAASVPTLSMSPGLFPPMAEIDKLAAVFRAAGFAIYAWRCSAASLLYTAIGGLSGHIDGRTKVWDAVAGAALCASAGLDVRWGCTDERLWLKVGDADIHEIAGQIWETKGSRSSWI